MMEPEIEEKLRRVRLLLLDVDGVMTDGKIIYHDDGGETKVFHVRDGLGLRAVMSNGIRVGVVTGRASSALRHRLANLGIDELWESVTDKSAVLDEILACTGFSPLSVAFVGDDLPDLPIMRRVGIGIAVADAHETVLRHAGWITRCSGGSGAVREVCEALLKARGVWRDFEERFF